MSISFDDLAKMTGGECIYECEGGINIKTKVLTAPILGTSEGEPDRRTLKWDAENTENQEKIAYFVTDGYMHYGPRLYTEPQYAYRNRLTGEITFPLLGAKKDPPNG